MILWFHNDIKALNHALNGYMSGRVVAEKFYECDVIKVMYYTYVLYGVNTHD